jgi:hypothetical protein
MGNKVLQAAAEQVRRHEERSYYSGLARQAAALDTEGRTLAQIAAAFECSQAAAWHFDQNWLSAR